MLSACPPTPNCPADRGHAFSRRMSPFHWALILLLVGSHFPFLLAQNRSRYTVHDRTYLDVRYLILRHQLPLPSSSTGPIDLSGIPSLGATGLPSITAPQKIDSYALLLMQPFYDQGAGIFSWGEARLGNLLLVNQMILEPTDALPPNYLGKTWRGLAGYTRQAFLDYSHTVPSFQWRLTAGRFEEYLGPGRTGQLFLSAGARPLDQVRLLLRHGPWEVLAGASELDVINGRRRYFSYHRLAFQIDSWLVAATEGIVFSRMGGADLALLNPFQFYHLEQNNGPALSGNTMVSFTGRYLGKGWSLYGEFLMDDAQADHKVKGDLEPAEIGGLIGWEWALPQAYLGLELVALTNRTYKTADTTEWYLHRGAPLGYPAGSDLGRVNFHSRWYLNSAWQLDGEVDYLARGEGELSKPWDTPWMADSVTMETGYDEPFPTGVVERTVSLKLELTRIFRWDRWLSVVAKYYHTDNIHHQRGISDQGWEITGRFVWEFGWWLWKD